MKEKTLEFPAFRNHNDRRSKEEKCFKCSQIIKIKWVLSQKSHSRKNLLFYWTENEEDQGKYICSNCIRHWYYQECTDFRQRIASPKKANVLRTYLSTNNI